MDGARLEALAKGPRAQKRLYRPAFKVKERVLAGSGGAESSFRGLKRAARGRFSPRYLGLRASILERCEPLGTSWQAPEAPGGRRPAAMRASCRGWRRSCSR